MHFDRTNKKKKKMRKNAVVFSFFLFWVLPVDERDTLETQHFNCTICRVST